MFFAQKNHKQSKIKDLAPMEQSWISLWLLNRHDTDFRKDKQGEIKGKVSDKAEGLVEQVDWEISLLHQLLVSLAKVKFQPSSNFNQAPLFLMMKYPKKEEKWKRSSAERKGKTNQRLSEIALSQKLSNGSDQNTTSSQWNVQQSLLLRFHCYFTSWTIRKNLNPNFFR